MATTTHWTIECEINERTNWRATTVQHHKQESFNVDKHGNLIKKYKKKKKRS